MIIKLIVAVIAAFIILPAIGYGYQKAKVSVASDMSKFGRRDPLTWILLANVVLIGGAFLLAAVMK